MSKLRLSFQIDKSGQTVCIEDLDQTGPGSRIVAAWSSEPGAETTANDKAVAALAMMLRTAPYLFTKALIDELAGILPSRI